MQPINGTRIDDGPTRIATPADAKRGEAAKAAAAVEGMFVSMLVSEMKKTLESGGFFGDAPGSDIFDGMFERLMGEEIAKKGGFGLGAYVEEQLKVQAAARQAGDQKAELERTGNVPGHQS